MNDRLNQKRMRGRSVYWEEVKKGRKLSLTDTAWDLLEKKGKEMGGLSRSQVIEFWVRECQPN